jgi:hypothetical protein
VRIPDPVAFAELASAIERGETPAT